MAEILTFKLARVAHGQRNVADSWEEQFLHRQAADRKAVLLPGLDAATAWAMGRIKDIDYFELRAFRATPDIDRPSDPALWQEAADRALVSRGWAVFMPMDWKHLHHVVRYFDLIEQNEAPDTPLLEWLIAVGVVSPKAARTTLTFFTAACIFGRTTFVLHEDDVARIKLAVEVRRQLEAEEKAARDEPPSLKTA
jgi:hypothetical protein